MCVNFLVLLPQFLHIAHRGGVTFQIAFFLDDLLRLRFLKSDVSDCVKILVTTFSVFQKSKNLPTPAYLSRRRYVGDKLLFFSFF